MKIHVRLALLSIVLWIVPAQGGAPLPPQIDGHCLSHYRTSWDMVDDVFVQQPKRTTRLSWSKRIGGSIATVAAGLAAGWLGHKLYISALDYGMHNVTTDSSGEKVTKFLDGFSVLRNSKSSEPVLSFAHLLALPALWFTGTRLFKALRATPILDNVVRIWKEARNYFPQELHDTFDVLYELKESKSPAFESNKEKALGFVLAKLNEHRSQLKETKYSFPEITTGYSITKK